jgi:hypothetical protein
MMQKKTSPRLVLAFLALLLPVLAHAQVKESPEQKAVHAMLLYCIPVLVTMDDARIAEIEKLPRVPPASEKFYLRNRSGKVFYIPDTGNTAVLVTYYQSPICSIAMRQLDPREFVKQMDMWFGSTTPFKLTSNVTSPTGNISREYKGTMATALLSLVVNIRQQPSANGVQAMMTVARMNNP